MRKKIAIAVNTGTYMVNTGALAANINHGTHTACQVVCVLVYYEWRCLRMAGKQAQHVPNRVRELRRQKGIETQTQLAKLVGWSQPELSRIENGERDLNPWQAGQLARALNVPLWKLFISAEELDEIDRLQKERKREMQEVKKVEDRADKTE